MNNKNNLAEIAFKREFNKPLPTDSNLRIEICRYYTDMNGTIIDKSSVPASLQISYPFYLFNYYDKNAGYKIGQILCPLIYGNYLYTFIWGMMFDYYSFSGLNNIKDNLRLGDIIHLYCDDISAPTYLIWIVQTNQQISIASIVENSPFTNLTTKQLLYQADNISQYNQTIFVVNCNELGIYKQNSFNPISNREPSIAQEDFIRIKLNIKLNQYTGLYSYILYDTDLMAFNINLIY